MKFFWNAFLLVIVSCFVSVLHAGETPFIHSDFEGKNTGFSLTTGAALTETADEVIAGKKSLCLDTSSSADTWHEILNSQDGLIPPNTTIEVRFDYRWLAKPDPEQKGFLYCLLRSRSTKDKDIGWTEKRFDEFRGKDGVVRRILNTGDLKDYRLIIGLHRQAKVAIDNLTVRILTPSTATPPESVGPPKGTKWVKVPEFSDEFNGKAIDFQKWEAGNGNWLGRAPAHFDKRNLSIVDGKLNLQLKRADYPKDPVLAKLPKEYHTWTSASIRSRTKQLYGFFEIRAKPVCATASSAFWFSDDGSEIDVFEIGGSAPAHAFTVHSTLHVFPKPWNNNVPHWARSSSWDLEQRPVDAFHIYSLQWDEKRVIVRIDGQEVATFENTHWHRPMPVIFDIETMPFWFGLPQDSDKLPASFEIDWIRTWKAEGKE